MLIVPHTGYSSRRKKKSDPTGIRTKTLWFTSLGSLPSDYPVSAKTYIPTGKPEMIFTMWFRAIIRNVAQESHYPCSLFKSTWLKSVTLSVNYSARRPNVALHALWNGILTLGAHAYERYSTHFVCVCPPFSASIKRLYNTLITEIGFMLNAKRFSTHGFLRKGFFRELQPFFVHFTAWRPFLFLIC